MSDKATEPSPLPEQCRYKPSQLEPPLVTYTMTTMSSSVTNSNESQRCCILLEIQIVYAVLGGNAVSFGRPITLPQCAQRGGACLDTPLHIVVHLLSITGSGYSRTATRANRDRVRWHHAYYAILRPNAAAVGT